MKKKPWIGDSSVWVESPLLEHWYFQSITWRGKDYCVIILSRTGEHYWSLAWGCNWLEKLMLMQRPPGSTWQFKIWAECKQKLQRYPSLAELLQFRPYCWKWNTILVNCSRSRSDSVLLFLTLSGMFCLCGFLCSWPQCLKSTRLHAVSLHHPLPSLELAFKRQ